MAIDNKKRIELSDKIIKLLEESGFPYLFIFKDSEFSSFGVNCKTEDLEDFADAIYRESEVTAKELKEQLESTIWFYEN